MIKQIDHKAWYKVNGITRRMIVSGIRPPGQLRPLVNEYPKSGGSWMAQMLSDALDLPFPRNRLPTIGDSIMHGHYNAKAINTPVIHICRDGRDVVTSFYFHRLLSNTFSASTEREKALKKLGIKDPNDVVTYMPRFIELLAKGETHPNISWSDFVESWHKHKTVVALVKYEDLLADSALELKKCCDSLDRVLPDTDAQAIAEKYSFESQTKRKQGSEDTGKYLRKGVAGDWKEKFSQEAKDTFSHYMGTGLVSLGYESNNDWTSQ